MSALVFAALFALGPPNCVDRPDWALDGLYSVRAVADALSNDDERLVVSKELSNEVMFCRATLVDQKRIIRDMALSCGGEWEEQGEGVMVLKPSGDVLRRHRDAMAESIAHSQSLINQGRRWDSAQNVSRRIAESIEFVLLRKDPTREPEPWLLSSVRPLDYLAEGVASSIDATTLVGLDPFVVHELGTRTLDQRTPQGRPSDVISMYRYASRAIADYLEGLTVPQDVSSLQTSAVSSARQVADATIEVYLYRDWRTVNVKVAQVSQGRVLGTGTHNLEVSWPHNASELPIKYSSVKLDPVRARLLRDASAFPRADSSRFKNIAEPLLTWFKSPTMDMLDLVFDPLHASLTEGDHYVFVSLPDNTLRTLINTVGEEGVTLGKVLAREDALNPISVTYSGHDLTILPSYPLLSVSTRYSRSAIRPCLRSSLDAGVLSLRAKAAVAYSSGLGVAGDGAWMAIENSLGSLGVLCTFEPLSRGFHFFGGVPASTQASLMAGQVVPCSTLSPQMRNLLFGAVLFRNHVGFPTLRNLASYGGAVRLDTSPYLRFRSRIQGDANISPPWMTLSSTLDRVANMVANDANDRPVSVDAVLNDFRADVQIGSAIALSLSNDNGSYQVCQGCGESVVTEAVDANHRDSSVWSKLRERSEAYLQMIRGGLRQF